MRYLLLCCLILSLFAGNCEAVACQHIQEECEYVFLVVNLSGLTTEVEVRVVTTDWDGKVRERILTYTIDPNETALRLAVNKSVSVQNIKWYVNEIVSDSKAVRRPAALRRTVAEVPDMECQCGDWGTLEVYYNGKLEEVRP